MGQARLKRIQGARISHCRDCTLCCSLPLIEALDKAMYRPCVHIADGGCGIFGQPERPATCIRYRCAYLEAQEERSPGRHGIPHPRDCGAYYHRDAGMRSVVMFVDPARPERWKTTALTERLREALDEGYSLTIFDRGRQMLVRNAMIFDALLKADFVRIAEAEGRPLDIASYAQG